MDLNRLHLLGTPAELVDTFRRGETTSIRTLEESLRPSLRVLIRNAKSMLRGAEVDLLTERLLSHIRVHLRVEAHRQPIGWPNESWKTFVARLLLIATRVASDLQLRERPQPDQGSHGWSGNTIQTYHEPFDVVGGDWLGLGPEDGRVLWILVADVSGKSVPAHLVVRGLPLLWNLCLEQMGPEESGLQLLAAIDRELQACLPEGVFVEAALVCLSPDGLAEVAAAGHVRVLARDAARQAQEPVGFFRRKANTVQAPERVLQLHRFGGPLLGLGIPGERSLRRWNLADGSEVLLASDGLFEQPFEDGQLEDHLIELLATVDADLHQAVLRVYKQVVSQTARRDDLLVVSINRSGTG